MAEKYYNDVSKRLRHAANAEMSASAKRGGGGGDGGGDDGGGIRVVQRMIKPIVF